VARLAAALTELEDEQRDQALRLLVSLEEVLRKR
jgi:hypothetical protein